jgi:prolyl-tRNA synthetase
MRQTNLFTQTLKQAPSDEVSLNSRLLIRGGFIDKTMAGVYTFLPLGWRVLRKIEQIIREEMDAIGGQEVLMPSLSPRWPWEMTGRVEEVDVLFSAGGANKASRTKNSAEYILNSTHEEIITPLVQKYISGYKDLPIAVYQIQTKFRNEPRPKSGLLRGREFRMKDLYSFHRDEQDLRRFYDLSKEAYWKICERLGIKEDTHIVLASGGDFTKDFSHEFQTECQTGEDLIFRDPAGGVCYNREVAPVQAPAVDSAEEKKELQKVHTPGMKTVDQLVKFLGGSKKKTIKTLLYKSKDSRVIAVALRGDRQIDEEKLSKVTGEAGLELAGPELIKEKTGADVGYAGLLGLPDDIAVYVDNSLKGLVNFEMGGNETDYHYTNVNFGRDIPEPNEFYDVKVAEPGDVSPESGKEYETFKASEVGNIFPLNVKFSKSFNYYYDDENGEKQIIYMGSYGFGPSRVMGVLAEKFSDEQGLVWPEQVAPFLVHLLQLPDKDGQTKEKSEELYSELTGQGVEVLYDDRQGLQAGEKFADADLIGCPYRVVVSAKTIEKGGVEVKKRNEKESRIVMKEELLEMIGD